MNRRTAIKSMLGSSLLIGGCRKEASHSKPINKADKVKLLFAIKYVESGGDIDAVGANGELGPYQLTVQYVIDVNRIVAINKMPFGRYRLSHRQFCRYCNSMMEIYWDHYATIERLGHEPTLEDLARIHNGGPNGYKKQSTKVYWEKVKVELAKM